MINISIFFFNATATTEIYTLSLHDALPILTAGVNARTSASSPTSASSASPRLVGKASALLPYRSEEHTSELQSRRDLVCRLLLEKKKRLKVKISEVVIGVLSLF